MRQLLSMCLVFIWYHLMLLSLQTHQSFEQVVVVRTACSRFQSFCSSPAIRGACPIFTYWTLLTRTYRAQLIAGTSRTDESWSVSESISPSSMGIGADVGPGLSIWLCWTGVGWSISLNGSTVHCSE